MARAPEWHSGGRGFNSLRLHQIFSRVRVGQGALTTYSVSITSGGSDRPRRRGRGTAPTLDSPGRQAVASRLLKKLKSYDLWIAARPAAFRPRAQGRGIAPTNNFRIRFSRSGWTAGPAAVFFNSLLARRSHRKLFVPGDLDARQSLVANLDYGCRHPSLWASVIL